MEENISNIITRVEVQKKNKNRVNVYVDEEFLFACSSELIYRFNLKSGDKVDIENIKEIVEEDDYIKCKNAGLKIIEKIMKTEKEVYDKLLKKGYNDNTVTKTIKILKDYKFINDGRYAEMYIKEKLRTSGRNKIKYELIRKGISKDILQEKIDNADSKLENEMLMKLAKDKYEKLIKRETDSRKTYKKLGEFLARKGYNYQDIKQVLNVIFRKD